MNDTELADRITDLERLCATLAARCAELETRVLALERTVS